MLGKAETSVNKELDLIKFIQRQRQNTFSNLATLNARQQFMVDKMSTMLIRESSDLNDRTDTDDELMQENVVDIEHHSRKIFLSKKKMDRRIIQAY